MYTHPSLNADTPSAYPFGLRAKASAKCALAIRVSNNLFYKRRSTPLRMLYVLKLKACSRIAVLDQFLRHSSQRIDTLFGLINDASTPK